MASLLEKISDGARTLGPDEMLEEEFMNEVMPESKGKTGSDLEPYIRKFNDALYIGHKAANYDHKTWAAKAFAEWKRDKGYLEGE